MHAATRAGGLDLRLGDESWVMPAGQAVTVTEEEMEHVIFTIQNLIGEEGRRVTVEGSPHQGT